MKWPIRYLTGVPLLVSAVCAASAQTYWSYGGYGLKARGYDDTPFGPGPQYGSDGGDQYGYGPAYNYARPAPSG